MRPRADLHLEAILDINVRRMELEHQLNTIDGVDVLLIGVNMKNRCFPFLSRVWPFQVH